MLCRSPGTGKNANASMQTGSAQVKLCTIGMTASCNRNVGINTVMQRCSSAQSNAACAVD